MPYSSILIVDDDQDDQYLIQCAANELKLPRKLRFFNNGKELTNALAEMEHPPFLIICDVNLPGENGFEVKQRMTEDPEMKYKSVPFIFWSNAILEKHVQKAYDLPAQGFFEKPAGYPELCQTFKAIVDYWQQSRHPKKVS